MYIRVKRQRSTIFLHVEPTETVLEVKQKVQQLTEQPAENQRLYLDGVNLDDAKTLAEVKVDNDAVLAVVFKLNGTCTAGPRDVGQDLASSSCGLQAVKAHA
jgi:transcription elongation factor B subunit 2